MSKKKLTFLKLFLLSLYVLQPYVKYGSARLNIIKVWNVKRFRHHSSGCQDKRINCKELILCHKLRFSNLYIFEIQCCKPLTFQTFIIWSNRSHSLKCQRSTTLDSKDIGIRKSEFVAKTQFLWGNLLLFYESCKIVFSFIAFHLLMNYSLIFCFVLVYSVN